jgi:hypothetical protein
VYTSDPIPRPVGPPASSTPLQDFLDTAPAGVISDDSGYVVLPRSLGEHMPLPWQQRLVSLLYELHQAYGELSWPVYRVVPSRTERLVDLDEGQLADAGYHLEIDGAGELVYRDRDGNAISDPEAHEVLVRCLDPIPRTPPPDGP